MYIVAYTYTLPSPAINVHVVALALANLLTLLHVYMHSPDLSAHLPCHLLLCERPGPLSRTLYGEHQVASQSPRVKVVKYKTKIIFGPQDDVPMPKSIQLITLYLVIMAS